MPSLGVLGSYFSFSYVDFRGLLNRQRKRWKATGLLKTIRVGIGWSIVRVYSSFFLPSLIACIVCINCGMFFILSLAISIRGSLISTSTVNFTCPFFSSLKTSPPLRCLFQELFQSQLRLLPRYFDVHSRQIVIFTKSFHSRSIAQDRTFCFPPSEISRQKKREETRSQRLNCWENLRKYVDQGVCDSCGHL